MHTACSKNDNSVAQRRRPRHPGDRRPVRPLVGRLREPLHDGEHWMGPRSMYEGLGFEPVLGDGGQYPVMRKPLEGQLPQR